MIDKKEIQVNEAMAELFYNQCMGTYSGHMANIPNNPVLSSICSACGVSGKKDFKEFMRLLSENLKA